MINYIKQNKVEVIVGVVTLYGFCVAVGYLMFVLYGAFYED